MSIRRLTFAPTLVVFVLVSASTLGAGMFSLPLVFDGISTTTAVASIVTIGVVFTATLAAFGVVLSRREFSTGDDFVHAATRQYLGERTARISQLLMGLTLITFLVGFSHAFADIVGEMTGVGPIPVGLALISAVVLQQRTRNVTANVSTAMILGLVNITMLVLVLIIALPSISTERLSGGTGPLSDGTSLRLTLTATLGFVISLFYGHPGVANAARASRGWGNRRVHVVRGTVLAGGTVTVLLSSMLVIGRGAADPTAIGSDETILNGLIATAGLPMQILAGTYVVGQLALAVFQASMSLVHLTREQTHAGVGAVVPSVLCLGLGTIGAAVGTEGLVMALELSGVLFVPVVGGALPLLLLRSAWLVDRERNGGRIIVAAGIVVAATPALTHAIVWSSPVLKLAAVVAIGLTMAVGQEAISRPVVARSMHVA